MIEVVKNILTAVDFFFLIYLIIYSTFLILSVTVGAVTLYERRRQRSLNNEIEHDYYIPVSIIVPAYNESITVVDTVKSLLRLDYSRYEIVVVDDGSTDDTSSQLISYFKMQPISRPIRKRIPCMDEEAIYAAYRGNTAITLIRKQNGGKSDALNMGINASEFPYFICMDADSVLQRDALKNIARQVLQEPNVIACGGLVRIVNDVTIEDGVVVDYSLPRNLLLSLQVLEYDRTFLASRLLFDKFNGNLIISGAFGIFQKEMVISVGGYDTNTMGEDMELVVKLHAFCRSNHIPYRISYAPDAVCWSQAPDNLRDLCKQRKRWHIGLLQSIHRHSELLFNPVHGTLSFLSFMYYMVYELYSPFIELFGVICTAVSAFMGLINVNFMVTFFAIYAVFSAIMSVTAFFSRIHAMNLRLKKRDVFKALCFCLVENVGMRMILAGTRLFAVLTYRKNKNDWGEIKRRQIKQR